MAALQMHARQLEEEQKAIEQAPPTPALLMAPGAEDVPAPAHCGHIGVCLASTLILFYTGPNLG
jgi:hypothetical protein